MPKLSFKPVTKATKADFEAVFGKGGPNYCWCMAYRVTAEERKAASGSSERRELMLGRIERRVAVGLVGYLDGKPVAWVSVAPRDTFNDKLGGLEPKAGETVWSLTCMFLKREHRGDGLGHQLIAAAVQQAKKRKADVLEAYPVDPGSPSYRFMGFVPAFEAAGFKPVGEIGTRRHIMRLTI